MSPGAAMADRHLAWGMLAAAAYALLSHGLMVHAAAEPWAVAALFAPLLLGLGAYALARRSVLLLVLVASACGLLAFITWRGGAGDVNRLYLAQHVGIHLALGATFAASLRPGGVPMISGFALRVHGGHLTPDTWRYTRRLTGVWALYFFAMAAASLLIYLSLPWPAWSLFANLLTPLSALLLFGGEHLLRYRLHPEFERVNWRDALRASRQPAVRNAAETRR